MKRGKLCIVVVGLTAGLLNGREESVATRLKTSSEVLTEIMTAPDRGIPQDLLEKSECIVIVPGLKKAAFIIGGKYGRGFISCRSNAGPGWSAPAGVKVEGGSFGFQIGGSETDAIMLVMNKRGAEKLYRVVSIQIVAPTEVSVLDPTPNENTLTLVTCYPFYFVGHAPKRFIVRARQVF